MGLDWLPGPKPKFGFEIEFEAIWHRVQSDNGASKSELRRFAEITSTAFETLAAPRVGVDEAATEWARECYGSGAPKAESVDEFLESLSGFYVLDLVPACDGIPRYSNGGQVDRYSFRAQFLDMCPEIIKGDLVYSAWESKLAPETQAYGDGLLQQAVEFADRNGLNLENPGPPDDPNSPEFQLDVVYSAAKWCRFWADRGHWLEAYF